MRKASLLVLLVITLSIVSSLAYLATPATAQDIQAYELVDPEGDDKGPGYYVYPTNDVFQPGVFDLTKFYVEYNGTHVIFKVYVKNLGDNPWAGPNGFCLQFPHIFVRTTADLPTNNTTFGLNVALADNSTWHFALLIAPGWEEKPVPEGQRAALYYANGTAIVQDGVLTVYADESENAIVAVVKAEALPDVENIGSWIFTVALAGYDGFGPMRVRPVTSDPEAEWAFGNGSAEAIAVGVEPRIIDLLAPTAEEQYQMLSSFKVDLEAFTGKPAVIHGVPLIAPPPIPTITVTVTEVVTKTVTETHTTTTTVEKTVTETTTSVATITQVTTETVTYTQTTTETTTVTTTTPVTQTVTETTTSVQTVTDYTATLAVGIILLLIGIGIGVVIGKRK